MKEHMKMLLQEIGVIRLILLYRFATLFTTSVCFLLSGGNSNFYVKCITILSLFVSCVIITYLYLELRGKSGYIKALMYIEFTCNCVVIFVSGGFTSVFIWYFISALMLAVLELSIVKVIIMSGICLIVSACGTSIIGLNQITKLERQLVINNAIGFIIVIISLLQIIHYANGIKRANVKKQKMNEELQKVNEKVNQLIGTSMELYEAINILQFCEDDTLYQQLLFHFMKFSKLEKCLFIHVNVLIESENYIAKGFTEEQNKKIIKLLLQMESTLYDCNRNDKRTLSEEYSLIGIYYGTKVLGFFVCERKEQRTEDQTVSLFLRLAGIMLHKLDYDIVSKELIISEEQNRIANEIHDIALQKLFVISCNLYVLGKECKETEKEQGIPNIEERIDVLKDAVDNTMKGLREAIYGLAWEKEGEDSFISKLKELVRELNSISRSHIVLKVMGDTQKISVEKKTVLYRILSEGINNAIRHGEAETIVVQVDVVNNMVAATVCDNGCGFVIREYRTCKNRGLGLDNMYRLIELVQGKITIKSTKGEGTRVSLQVPLNVN